MKLLFVLIITISTAWAQTNAELEVQINALQRQLQTSRADSVSTTLNTLVQTDVAFAAVKAAGVKIVNAASSEGTHDEAWVGVDIPDSLGITADEKVTAIAIIKEQYMGQDSPDADVRIRKDRHADVMAILKLFAE